MYLEQRLLFWDNANYFTHWFALYFVLFNLLDFVTFCGNNDLIARNINLMVVSNHVIIFDCCSITRTIAISKIHFSEEQKTSFLFLLKNWNRKYISLVNKEYNLMHIGIFILQLKPFKEGNLP